MLVDVLPCGVPQESVVGSISDLFLWCYLESKSASKFCMPLTIFRFNQLYLVVWIVLFATFNHACPSYNRLGNSRNGSSPSGPVSWCCPWVCNVEGAKIENTFPWWWSTSLCGSHGGAGQRGEDTTYFWPMMRSRGWIIFSFTVLLVSLKTASLKRLDVYIQ